MNLARSRLKITFIKALLAITFVTGCERAIPIPAPVPPAVTVAKPLQQEVFEWDTYNGYLEAVDTVNVSARVSGMIVAAPFVEGSIVKKNQLLYEIDERPFKADLDLKLADEEKAKAEVAIALLNYRRQEDIYKRNASSQQDFDTAKADYAKATAVLAGTKASVETARLNLSWCQVTSPIEGRIGRKIITIGNLVTGGGGPGTPTQLTTIQSVSPIYCNIDVDERSIQKYLKLAWEKKRTHERDGKVPCYARLSTETAFSHVGFIDFLDNRLDSTTGTQRMRGLIQNESGKLTPGFYANLRIPGSGLYQALLVPDAAIGNDQSQRTVLVVNKENTVEVRIVEIGALFGSLRSIRSGLTPNDKVIVNGQMRAFPGAPVAPTESELKYEPPMLVNASTHSAIPSNTLPVSQPPSGK